MAILGRVLFEASLNEGIMESLAKLVEKMKTCLMKLTCYWPYKFNKPQWLYHSVSDQFFFPKIFYTWTSVTIPRSPVGVNLRAALYYNKKQDFIEGFEYAGDRRRKAFTDHATVFMLRGIHKKWKELITYFFVESCMSCNLLVKNIKIIIRCCTAIGLKIVATVSGKYSCIECF